MDEHEEACYGYFPGGDPRDFVPDPEACTPEEMAAHKKACAEWDAGRGKDVGPPCTIEHVDITATDDERIVGQALVTRAHYGMGTYVIRWKDDSNG